MKRCTKCAQQIIPAAWADAGWGPGPHYGLGICGCSEGLPVLVEGDLIVDAGFGVAIAQSQTYGYNAKKVMTIARRDEYGYFRQIWTRET